LPDAKLHVYSMSLDKGRQGGAVDEALKPIFDLAIAASQQGVDIRRPGGDLDMSPAYRQARVHLHPGHPDDMLASTLAESQAAGIPAVARPLGAAAERIQDGRTGFLAPDEAAFANTALTLLKDDGVFWGFSRDAKLLQAGRSWEIAAEQFEAVLAQRPA
jgi:glycosyltransferase involved in cell wall biosynthesis